jgi:hypothetical protein
MIAAVVSIASAVLGTIITMVSSGGSIVGEVIKLPIAIILGIWLYQASVAFRKVALTDVADQAYLLEGFSKLRNYFMMVGIVLIVVISLAVLGLLGALMCGLAR